MSAKNATLGADGQRHGTVQSEGKFRKIVMQHEGLLKLNETKQKSPKKKNKNKNKIEPMLPSFYQRIGWLKKANQKIAA